MHALLLLKPKLFRTKAETLACVEPHLRSARVPPFLYFTVNEWTLDRAKILKSIESLNGDSVAVRSSSVFEDQAESSMAGAFTSVQNVPKLRPLELSAAINKVIDSMPENPDNQVCVQEFLSEVKASGVMTTYRLSDFAPYYVINYDDLSGDTSSITGGIAIGKSVSVFRGAASSSFYSSRIMRWVQLAKELEQICDCDRLDIEFALGADDVLYLLQIRMMVGVIPRSTPSTSRFSSIIGDAKEFVISRSAARDTVCGSKTIFADMPDWNPAEILGAFPKPLALSLYEYLITDQTWREARGAMGYFDPAPEKLMISILGKPYVDVRNSFNSFTPARLDSGLRAKIVDAWLRYLEERIELHDKVEFSVAQTCYDLNFAATFSERYHDVLAYAEFNRYESTMKQMTSKLVSLEKDSSYANAWGRIEAFDAFVKRFTLEKPWTHQHASRSLAWLLHQCRMLGAIPFAILARHAFIGESLLRSLVDAGAMSTDEMQRFKASISTVSTAFVEDFYKVLRGKISQAHFLAEYGHLRPGTYDLHSPRYDQMGDLFANAHALPEPPRHEAFDPSRKLIASISRALKANKFEPLGAKDFLKYIGASIRAREASKFVYSKGLSLALEIIKSLPEVRAIDPQHLSYLRVDDIFEYLHAFPGRSISSVWSERIEERRSTFEQCRSFALSYVIRNERDIDVVASHRSEPNFITWKQVTAPIVVLSGVTAEQVDLHGKIVCIENADPGFDWIFSRGIVGLVTKFGGANSHMAIRCSEFSLPAAIGCGHELFERIAGAESIEIDGKGRLLRIIDEVHHWNHFAYR